MLNVTSQIAPVHVATMLRSVHLIRETALQYFYEFLAQLRNYFLLLMQYLEFYENFILRKFGAIWYIAGLTHMLTQWIKLTHGNQAKTLPSSILSLYPSQVTATNKVDEYRTSKNVI